MVKRYDIDGVSDEIKLGKNGVVLRDNAGVIEVRDTTGASLVPVRAGAPAGSDDVATRSWVESNVSLSSVIPTLSVDQTGAGLISTRTVTSNSIGFGAILCSDADGNLVEAQGGVAQGGAGLYIALEAGTGSRQVLYYGGWVRNDAWSFTPGQAIFLDRQTAGLMTNAPYFGYDSASDAVGFAESANIIYFGPVHKIAEYSEIVFTTEGATFEPILTVDAGATIEWLFDDDERSYSATPTKDYGSAATRVNSVRVTPWSALTEINIGYDAGEDGDGGITLNAQQNVSTITGLSLASNLELFCASNNPITALDFSGCNLIQDLELLNCSSLATLDVSNASVLTRLCMSGDAVASLDVSDCVLLEDLRAAANTMTTLTLDTVGPTISYFDLSDNSGLNALPSVATWINLATFIASSANQSGSIVFGGGNLAYVDISDNAYTSLDVSSGFDDAVSGVLYASNNSLATVDVSNSSEILDLDLSVNLLLEATVDAILGVMDAYATSNGTLDISGNEAPSVTGEGYITSLEGRGWTVTTGGAAPTISSTTPNDNDTDVLVDTSFEIIFSELVNAQAGGTIDIRLTSDDSLFEQFDVTTDITGDGTTTIGFTPSTNLSNSEGYYVLISAGAFQNGTGVDFAGISDTTAWNFTTIAGSTILWQDDFSGYSTTDPSENNWVCIDDPTPAWHDIDLVNEIYHRSDTGAYRRSYNPATGTLPADCRITAIIPNSCVTTDYWGILGRITAAGVGLKLFEYSGLMHFGPAETFGSDLETFTPNFVGTGDHTFVWEMNGDQHTFTIDGTQHGPYTSSVGQGVAGLGVGTCGDAGGDKDFLVSITVESL